MFRRLRALQFKEIVTLYIALSTGTYREIGDMQKMDQPLNVRMNCCYLLALLGFFCANGNASGYSCSEYNQQAERAEKNLQSELAIANEPLTEQEAANSISKYRKLDKYIELFSDDAIVHGVQGRPEPASKTDMREHYQYVLTAPRDNSSSEGALQETVSVVAGPMAAHRYKAGIRVGAFPPDFAYYDINRLLHLRGQTVFDYSGDDGKISRRWSNHDNKYRTGQLWRYMLRHPKPSPSPAALSFRQDLMPGDELMGGLIDLDGERLNRVFNGELVLQESDFVLSDKHQFVYGSALAVDPALGRVSEHDGLLMSKRFLDHANNDDLIALFAADAEVYGARCHEQGAQNQNALDTPEALVKQLQGQVPTNARIRLAPPFSFDHGYDYLPISAWSMLGFRLQTTQKQTTLNCASVILRLKNFTSANAAEPETKITHAWYRFEPDCKDSIN